MSEKSSTFAGDSDRSRSSEFVRKESQFINVEIIKSPIA